MYFSHDSGHEPDIVVATRPVGAVQVGAGGLRQESRSRECCDDGDVGNPCWRGFGFSTSWAVVYSCSVYLKVANIASC